VIHVITEEQIEKTISQAERSFQDCWVKLATMKDVEAFFSFQPTLLNALYRVEAVYQAACKEKRELIAQKSESDTKQFSERMKILASYEKILNQVLDMGKVLGDAFAWIFYGTEKQLLKKHYEHEFIPHLSLGIGGRGEYEFANGAPRFGKYLVLMHSITTFLRHGDVSLIDPADLKVVAIGEIKSQKKSDTEISVAINLFGKKLPKGMLPKTSELQTEPVKTISDQLPPQLFERFKRQAKGIQEAFEPQFQNHPPENFEINLLQLSSLKGLLDRSLVGKWSSIKVDRGLMLVGMKFEIIPLYLQLKREPLENGESLKQNLENLKEATAEILDKNLSHNHILTSWLLYPIDGRYFLPFGMRPLFFWPLDVAVRKALIFQQMRVLTLYNPAFLVNDLRRAGLEVELGKDKDIKIVKKIGRKHIVFSGVGYFIGMVKTQFVSDASIVNLIQRAMDKFEVEDFSEPSCIDLNFDFIYE
jgi:hypothetical protein